MRRMLERVSPVLLAAVVAGGFVVSSSLPATAEGRDERRDRLHSERPIAALPRIPAEVAVIGELAAIEQAVIVEAANADAAFRALVADALAARSAGGRAAVSSPGYGSCNGDVECFLECTRGHESDAAGGYGAVSGSGTYRGAYQFNQNTWDAAAAGAGHAEYAGVPADQVPPEVQDAAAAHLYSVSGTRPWGGRC